MSTVIAIANQKGGVGKTTTTVNVAYVLAQKGQRVLTIDMDPQASLTIYFGQNPRELEEKQKTVYWCLSREDIDLSHFILQGANGSAHLIPGSIQLAKAEQEFAQQWDSVSFLKDTIAQIQNQYDFILVDCPPTLTLLTVNSLVAANSVLIPVKTDYLSIMGIPLLIETIENVRRRQNPQLGIIGVVPTMFNARNKHDNDALAEIKESLEPDIRVFDPISRSTHFDNAAAEGRSTLELRPNFPAAQNYYSLTDYLIAYAIKA
ncbi:MAG: plasmid partitioning protein ParA [Candidatus Entotheonella factor]|uniref:Plasmid partitioning protein ParA n=1 Tax=Entotheonella factor TaxID=1429438 RepID=W4LEY5_ENTF1|nr:MAG: plasmid partitioning protein ParA [Candidatus Entotheonella factor]